MAAANSEVPAAPSGEAGKLATAADHLPALERDYGDQAAATLAIRTIEP